MNKNNYLRTGTDAECGDHKQPATPKPANRSKLDGRETTKPYTKRVRTKLDRSGLGGRSKIHLTAKQTAKHERCN